MSKKPQEESIDTLAATAGSGAPAADSIVPPVYQASVFPIENLEDTDDLFEGRKPGYFYSRDGNPTTDAFAQAVALLEGAEAGTACSSGMGATLVALLAVAEPGTRLVAARDLYGKATALLHTVFSPLGIDVEFVDGQDVGAWEQALSRPAGAVFLETETNPLLRVPDLPRIADAARKCGATVVVDNTFASPYHIRPLDLGADLVVHSATKFLSGHGDVTAGVVVGDAARIAAVKGKVSLTGVNLAPLRGMAGSARPQNAGGTNGQEQRQRCSYSEPPCRSSQGHLCQLSRHGDPPRSSRRGKGHAQRVRFNDIF